MIGLALSGGGSRAMAFHLGCLRALDDLGVLNRIDVLSTISGGSIIGAYYAYTPEKEFAEFESDIRRFLARGFTNSILLRLVQPKHTFAALRSLRATTVDAFRERITGGQPIFRGYPSRTDLFREVLEHEMFAGLKMHSPRRQNCEVVIGACELQTGSAFRFGNSRSGTWRFGELLARDIEVSFAAAASAAYPLFLPPLDRQWRFRKDGVERKCRVVLTDGGVYDNLGLQVLEPERDPAYSIHTFPCEHLIVCNAGHGQSLELAPVRFLPRISRAFAVVHRRVQDSAMHRLHSLLKAETIKGFAMPYLGQQDDLLPLRPSMLVPRSDVVTYPTDFSAMSQEWIDKLSNRGEQLTRLLMSCYLADLLG
jgi:NTE family protein